MKRSLIKLIKSLKQISKRGNKIIKTEILHIFHIIIITWKQVCVLLEK